MKNLQSTNNTVVSLEMDQRRIKRIRYFMRVKAQAIARELHTSDWEPIYQQIQNRVFEFFHVQALEQLPSIKYVDVLFWIDEQLFGLHNEFGKAVCRFPYLISGLSRRKYKPVSYMRAMYPNALPFKMKNRKLYFNYSTQFKKIY